MLTQIGDSCGRFGFIPEVFIPSSRSYHTNNDDWPLRPEFIESTYLLYRATKHPFYLHVAALIVRNIQMYTRVQCGFASVGIHDLSLDDRMDSFFLAETLKYLYLIFDEANWFNHHNVIFSTEAHMFPVDQLISLDATLTHVCALLLCFLSQERWGFFAPTQVQQ